MFYLICLIPFIIVILLIGYVKAPPNKALVISGPHKKPRIIIGGAGFRIPIIERVDSLVLSQLSIDIKTNGYVPTKDFIGVDIDAVAKVQIDTSPEGIELAMRNFLNMKAETIATSLTDSLQGNMREIVGTVELRELNTDRKKFGDEAQTKAQADMNALGIRIISCNIQRIEDEQGLINALGQDNMSKIQKDASIAKATADRDVQIARAQAEKEANEARVAANKTIAERNTELEIRQSELKIQSDIKKAEADAAYKIQEQEQRKSIEVAATNAEIAKQEREIELKQKEADVKEQELSASVRKQADAEKYKRQQEAEAKFIEQQKNAEGIRLVAEAEASAIRAKGIAEAEAIDRKAEAMQKYGQAAMMEMLVNVLPDIAKAIAEPLTAIDKVTIIDSGSGASGVTQMGSYVPAVLAKTIEAVKETTGFDITETLRANTYDAKVNKNLNVDVNGDGDWFSDYMNPPVTEAKEVNDEEDNKQCEK